MTRFCGDAIGVRSKGASAYTKKDLRKNMEKFIQTGVHPDIAKAQERARQEQVPALPDHDGNRDFVLLEIKYGNDVLGRLVIELFTDIVPAAANHFRNRCLHGSQTWLKGAQVYKLQSHYALFLGKDPSASEGLRLQPNPRLRHTDLGAVSISLNGDEVAIALGRALVMDKTHQVVGRVHSGKDVLERLNDAPVDHNDTPLRRITVSLSGSTNAQGAYEELDSLARNKSRDPAQRLAEESAGAREAVLDALAEGLSHKRKAGGELTTGGPQEKRAKDSAADTAGPPTGASSVAGPSKAKQGGSGPVAGASRSKMMDAMLGDVSDVSSSDDEDSEGGGS